MLDFLGYPDKVVLFKTSDSLDDWGLSTTSNNGIPVRCRITENLETIQLSGDKKDSYISRYTIMFPSNTLISEEDKIEVNNKVYKIAKLKISRDLFGNKMSLKVWL